MPHKLLKTIMLLGPVLICPAVFGQSNLYEPTVIQPEANAQSYAAGTQIPPQPIQQATQSTAEGVSIPQGTEGGEAQGMYPILNAPLYPVPRPNIPTGVGMTTITNPALAPHEMLYPHRNTGLYGPFYHKTTRGWILTPLGIYRKERRVLTGTTVDVKYKGHISPFALFMPPLR